MPSSLPGGVGGGVDKVQTELGEPGLKLMPWKLLLRAMSAATN